MYLSVKFRQKIRQKNLLKTERLSLSWSIEKSLDLIFFGFFIMMKLIIIFCLFIGTNCSFLGKNCHLNETQPDLVFSECMRIEANDFRRSCPVFDSSICQSDPCFCDPLTLPISVWAITYIVLLLFSTLVIFFCYFANEKNTVSNSSTFFSILAL